jgi:hypothetical protein
MDKNVDDFFDAQGALNSEKKKEDEEKESRARDAFREKQAKATKASTLISKAIPEFKIFLQSKGYVVRDSKDKRDYIEVIGSTSNTMWLKVIVTVEAMVSIDGQSKNGKSANRSIDPDGADAKGLLLQLKQVLMELH